MKLLLTFLFLKAALALAQNIEVPDKNNRGRSPGLIKISGAPAYQILNINNITTWLGSNGQSNHSPKDNNGALYPRGTAAVIFQDGFLWAGKAYLDANCTLPAPSEALRIGGQTYNIGTVAGRIIGQGAAAMPAEASSPEVRCYRIRRDFAEFYFLDEASRDAAEYFEINPADVTSTQVEQIKTQYEKDWKEWPVQLGAPYIERNRMPGYQPPPTRYATELIPNNYDEPGLAGLDPENPADQVIWTVCNDLNEAATRGLYGSPPLGFEAQVTLWGYKRTDALGNIYFKRLRLINKGKYWIDSLFVGQWSDPDVGDFGDDLAGCDTLRNLAFCYNTNRIDREFQKFNLPPPAIGYTLLAGLIVPGAPADQAFFDFKKIAGKKNLPMTSFAYQGPSSSIDPIPGEWRLQYWRMLQGYFPDFSNRPWRLYPHPPGVTPTKFPLSGDPVTHTGFVDGLGTDYSFAAGDRRMLMSMGPIRFAPGDTQDVIIATVAGLGADRLSSITAMRFHDRAVKQAFRNLSFVVARPPAQPQVRALALDREIILDWGSDLAQVENVEAKIVAAEYAFEGYNIFQLPAITAELREGVKIATFDVANGVTTILDERFDPASGLILPVLLQRGEDTGIRRHLRLTRDALTQNQRLNNGQEYYFAVTAYNYSAQGFPKSLESAPRIIKIKPQIPFGALTPVKYGDTLRVTHAQGHRDGVVYPIVINALAGTGDSYEVRFDTTRGATTWQLRNASQNQTLLTNQNLGAAVRVEGGIELTVLDPLNGAADVFTYLSPAPDTSRQVQKRSAQRVNVFPNPYYAGHSQEKTRARRFVTFNNLPPVAKIRIFNLAGQLVRTLEKNNPEQFLEWDLTNAHNWQVASGMYLCHIEMPALQETKILKLAVVQAQLMPER